MSPKIKLLFTDRILLDEERAHARLVAQVVRMAGFDAQVVTVWGEADRPGVLAGLNREVSTSELPPVVAQFEESGIAMSYHSYGGRVLVTW